jgi:hypothetical protein
MRSTILIVVFALLLVVLAVNAAPRTEPSFSPGAGARGSTGAWFLTAQAASSSQPRIQVFTGTIFKTGSQFLLNQDGTKASYQLDDQGTASRFDGQQVRVAGILDPTNNIIRVQSIELSTA